MNDNRFDLKPHSFVLDAKSSAVYYFPDEPGSKVALLLIAPTRDMAVKLAHDLSKFYDVPLTGWLSTPEKRPDADPGA